MKQKFLQAIAALLVLCMHLPTIAEDIDLFVGVPPATTALPNVLIIVDNTANWNTAFANEKAALVNVFNGMPVNKFRVGMMMFTESGGQNSGNDGAYVRLAARTITNDNKSLYANAISALDQTGDKSNGGKVAKAMWEAYQYLSGLAPHAGNNKAKTDFTANTAGSSSDDAVHALSGNALLSKSGTTYQRPGSDDCIKNYIIYISNGPAQDNSSDITDATNALASAGGTTTPVALNPSGSQDNPADEWARFLKKSALKASVYTIDVDKTTSGQGPGWTALLRSMASQSGGRYFDVSSTGSGIQDALNAILSEVLSVNSVFASVSLPVSVNTQGTYLNQVFVGMFRPDADGSPRWAGNLKQYKMAKLNGSLQLVDAGDEAAINNQTGFITECARSYWTPTSVDTEWATQPDGSCIKIANSEQSNYPDGNVVSKGAQAYKLRSGTSRTTYTCNSAACSSLVSFNNSNVTAAQLGVASTTDRDTIINWARGVDNQDDDIDSNSTENRLSMHGDVVHSRPVAINFGTIAAPQVVVFYGGNDGWFRAINGNRTDAIGSIPAGGEMWSFTPPEFLSKFARLRSRSPVVYYPETPVGSATRKDYAMDGPIAAYRGTVGGASGTKTFIYATMRRGGRSIYAFDVSNTLTTPTAPTFKWRVGCTADGTCTSGMDGIGQTWSPIQTFTSSNYSSGNTPLLVFGGGYDTCEDYDAGGANHNCTSTSKGHYIYVLDGNTGEVVKTFDTKTATGSTIGRGIIADVALVNSADGHAKYGYAVDLGGNVFRLNFQGATSAWSIKHIASLGCATTASCTSNRKFMFPPSVVEAASGEFTLLVGSGDREKPITFFSAASAVTNYFFSFTDKPAVASGTYPGSGDCGAELICLNSLLQIGRTDASPSATALAAKKGWYLGLNSTEQVVTEALTIFSVVTFSTHEPAVANAAPTTPQTCSNLGTNRVYNINFKDAGTANGTSNRYEDVAGDGLPPSGTAGLVTLDDGSTVPFCIGCSPDSPLQAKLPVSASTTVKPKGRLYWYTKKK